MAKVKSNTTIAADKLVDFITSPTVKFGDFYTHDELRGLMGLYNSSSNDYTLYQYAVAEAKKELEKLGKALKVIYKQGYQVINPDEYPTETIKHLKKSERWAQRANNMAINAPVSQMTSGAKKVHERVKKDATSISQLMRQRVNAACDKGNMPRPKDV